MKKAILVLFLALQFSGIVSIATAGAPWPDCLPCRVTLNGR